jgi:hypothetical protein
LSGSSGRRVLFSLAIFLAASVLVQAQWPRQGRDARRPADQTIADLKAISARNTFNPHEAERYDNAMTHLSQFAERLQQGHFDRGKLDHSIGDLQGILSRNPLDGRARDILNHDLAELRRLRSTYRMDYRYAY